MPQRWWPPDCSPNSRLISPPRHCMPRRELFPTCPRATAYPFQFSRALGNSPGCAPLAGGTATALPAQLHPPLAGAGGGQERPSAHAMRNEKAQTPHLIHIGTPLRPVTPLCHARSVGTPVPDGVGTNLPEIFGTPVPSQRDSSSAMLEANSDHGKQNTIPQSQ